MRGYFRPDGYKERLPYQAVAHVKLLGAGVAFVEAALRSDGQVLSQDDWRAMARILRDQHDVEIIEAVRHKRRVRWAVERLLRTDHAPLDNLPMKAGPSDRNLA